MVLIFTLPESAAAAGGARVLAGAARLESVGMPGPKSGLATALAENASTQNAPSSHWAEWREKTDCTKIPIINQLLLALSLAAQTQAAL